MNASDLRARHLSIDRHHCASAASSASSLRLFHEAIIARSTRAQSPMMPSSTFTVLLMEEGSMSTWILRDPGEKAVSSPVMRSSKRAPMLIITSQSCIAWLAS